MTSSLPVDTRAIEAELARAWREAADGAGGGLIRATSLTLLVLLVDEALAPRVDAILAEIAPANPCRLIIVSLDRSGEPTAHLAAHCRPPRLGEPPACWEDVRLEGRWADLTQIMSAARSLVLPNLPVVVWWPGEADLGGELFQRVVDLADRVIVDSSQLADPLGSLARYADQMVDHLGTVAFADLAWRRLEPWRLLLAQFFDTPADRAFLNYVQSVTISYVPAPGGLAEVLLVVGWLASRLGWVPTSQLSRGRGSSKLLFDDGGDGVLVEARPNPARGASHLTAIELEATDAGHQATYGVYFEGESARAVAEGGGQRREAQVSLPLVSEVDLLQNDLASLGRDRIYEEALQVVRELCRTDVELRAR